MQQIDKLTHWQAIFDEQANSGLTKLQYCNNNQIIVSTFYNLALFINVISQ